MTRVLKFGTVGLSGVGVNLFCVWIGVQIFSGFDTAVRDALASALGIAVSIFTNFLLNDGWTWGDRVKGAQIEDLASRFGAFLVASGVGATLQFGTAQLLALLFGVNIYLAQLAGIGVGSVLNFLINHYWTFTDQGSVSAGGAPDLP
ncbi:MAG: GtrA family protein [Gemmatimonadota bacterium]